MPTLLQTKALTKIYGDVQPVYALNEIDLTLEHGEFISIIGPSGSGKSTLMNMLGLLDRPTTGQLLYEGEPTQGWDERRKARFRNQEIGFIFQAHLLLPEFTALENVLMPVKIRQPMTQGWEARAVHLLERIGMGDRMTHYPTMLSGGQNQRVAIARALMNTPKIVFADEPTGALDSHTSQSVYSLMREINAQDGVTFVIVTHEKSFADRADRRITILDGKIQSDEYLAASKA